MTIPIHNLQLVYTVVNTLQEIKMPVETFQQVLQQGNLKDIKKFIDGLNDLNISDDLGWNMLLHSIVARDDIALETVKYLLGKGITIKHKDNWQNTSLICAAYTGNRELIDLIIRNGGKVNDKNAYGKSALMVVSSKTDADVLEFVTEHNSASLNVLMLNEQKRESVIRGRREDIAMLLIDHGADVNLKDIAGKTPLMMAATSGNLEIIKILIKHGANVNEKDNIGDTALMKAVSAACREENDISTLLTTNKIMDILISNGADINARNKFGITPLMRGFYGFGYSTLDKIEKILETWEKIEESKRKRRLLRKLNEPGMVYVPSNNDVPNIYPRHFMNNYIEPDRIILGIVKFLVKNGANINNTDNVGRTALMLASIIEMRDTVIFLISSGADLRIKDKQNFTSLDYTILHRNNSLFSCLKSEMMKNMNTRQGLFFNISTIYKKATRRLYYRKYAC